MDGRVLAASLAGAVTVGALVLAAVVVTGNGDPPLTRRPSPVLIARASPPTIQPDPGVQPDPPLAGPDGIHGASAGSLPAGQGGDRAPPAVMAALPPVAAPPLAPPPKPVPRVVVPKPPVVDHRYDGLLTVAEIGRIRSALKLSPDQEPYWPSIAGVLRDVGRRQMSQVDAGQKPDFDLPGDLSSRLYSAVGPLLGTLRDDQKDEVRRRAKMLGLDSVASFI